MTIRTYTPYTPEHACITTHNGDDFSSAICRAAEFYHASIVSVGDYIALLRARDGADIIVVNTPDHRLVEQDRTHWEMRAV